MTKDFKEFIVLLNDKKVEYLLVGGYAVILYGYPRYTGDIDFWVKPTKENGKKLLKVISEFGFGSLDISLDDLRSEDKVIQLGYPPHRIDIITSVEGLVFEECYPSRTTFQIDELSVPVISKEQLKINKKATGRHKDLDDLENL